MKENHTADNDTTKPNNGKMKEQVLEMIMKTTMTTGMWKQLLRKMLTERPEMTEWLHQNFCEHFPIASTDSSTRQVEEPDRKSVV